MEILPAWLIEELKKMEEERRERERPRIHIEAPSLPSQRPQSADDQEPEEHAIVITLR